MFKLIERNLFKYKPLKDSPRNYSKIVGNTIGICTIKIENDKINFKHVLTNETIFDEFSLIKNKTEDKLNNVIQLLIKPNLSKIEELNYFSYVIDFIILALFFIVIGFFAKILINNYRSNNLKKIFNEENMNIMNLIAVNNM